MLFTREKSQKLLPKRSKLKDPMLKLRRMSKQQQRKVVAGESEEFIKDMSKYISELRHNLHLVKKSKHRRALKRHGKKLHRLINSKPGVKTKSNILLMKGGIAPILIPIIFASIGKAGTVAVAGTFLQ